MPVSWRREDIGYAAAAAAAVAFLAYLVFGNFGLVPSPLAPAGAGDEVLVAIQAADLLPETFQEEAPTVALPPSDTEPRNGDRPVPPPPGTARDTAAPGAAFTTQNGISVTLTEPAVVEGAATDEGSGVREVNVTFTPLNGSPQTVGADMACEAGRNVCTWTAKVPGLVGDYTVVAEATDREGNVGKSETLQLTVVNVGSTVDDLVSPGAESVGETSGDLGEGVGGLLGGLGL